MVKMLKMVANGTIFTISAILIIFLEKMVANAQNGCKCSKWVHLHHFRRVPFFRKMVPNAQNGCILRKWVHLQPFPACTIFQKNGCKWSKCSNCRKWYHFEHFDHFLEKWYIMVANAQNGRKWFHATILSIFWKNGTRENGQHF